jgi:hypothetical protein
VAGSRGAIEGGDDGIRDITVRNGEEELRLRQRIGYGYPKQVLLLVEVLRNERSCLHLFKSTAPTILVLYLFGFAIYLKECGDK